MVLQRPPELKDNDRLTRQDLPAVDQFVANGDDPVEEAPLVERGTLMPLNPKQLPQTIVNGLSNFLAPEHLKGPLALIYRPIFVAAIGLHALLLFSGGGKHDEKKEVKEKEKPATITQIATGKAPKKLIKLPTTQLKPVKPVLPKLANPIAQQAPAIKPKPEEDKKPEDKKPDEKPPEKGAPKPETPTPPQKETPMPPGGAKKGDPFEDFNIVYPGAAAEGAFYRASGANGTAVAGFFKGQASQGFAFKDGTSSPERSVLEVSKGGVTRYLGIYPVGADTAYILVASESELPPDAKALQKIRALPADYNDAFTTIGTTAAGSPSSEDFTDYSLYWTGKESEGGTTKTGILTSYAYDEVTVDQATPTLIERIKPMFKDVGDAGSYGGGKLYRMTGATGDYFLNILAAKNGGTIVVTFENDPNK